LNDRLGGLGGAGGLPAPLSFFKIRFKWEKLIQKKTGACENQVKRRTKEEKKRRSKPQRDWLHFRYLGVTFFHGFDEKRNSGRNKLGRKRIYFKNLNLNLFGAKTQKKSK